MTAVLSPLDSWASSLIKCPFRCSFSVSECSCCSLQLWSFDACVIRHFCLPAAVTLTSELVFPFHPPHHTRPLIPHHSLKIFCFIVTPISILISISMWMILQILASFSAIPVDLIFPLILATLVLVILSTLWLPVKLSLQVSIQAISYTPL